jgi:hypothetical protein
MQARWYDPKGGRFLTPDPIGYAAGDNNLYRYVGNSAANSVDPFGLEEVGHHWIPKSVFNAIFNAGGMVEEARAFFDKFTTPTEYYTHGFDSFFVGNKVTTHSQYIGAVRELLTKYSAVHGPIDEAGARTIASWIFDESLLAKASKKLGMSAEAVAVITRYKQGLRDSVDIAASLTAKYGARLKPRDVKKLSIILTAPNSPAADVAKVIARYESSLSITAKTALKELRILRAAGGAPLKEFVKLGDGAGANALARTARFLGIVGGVLTLVDASNGFAGEGHHPHLSGILGATDEVIFQGLQGAVVEQVAHDAVAVPHINWFEVEQSNINIRIYGGLSADSPEVSAMLRGQRVIQPRSAPPKPTAPVNTDDTYGQWFYRDYIGWWWD